MLSDVANNQILKPMKGGTYSAVNNPTLRAIDESHGVNEYLFPDGKRKLIRYVTMNGTNCFFLEGDEIGKNFLETFPEC